MRTFKWTQRRRRLVDLLARGWSHVAISAHLGIHRNTVRNLLQRQEIRAAVAVSKTAYVTAMSFRRLHEATLLTNRAERTAREQLLLAGREQVSASDIMRRVRAALRTYRRAAREERKELDALGTLDLRVVQLD